MKSKAALIPFEKYLIESLKDPEEAHEYLLVSLEEYSQDHDTAMLLDSLYIIAAAKGGTLQSIENLKIDYTKLGSLLIEPRNVHWETVLETLELKFSPMLTEQVLPANQ